MEEEKFLRDLVNKNSDELMDSCACLLSAGLFIYSLIILKSPGWATLFMILGIYFWLPRGKQKEDSDD